MRTIGSILVALSSLLAPTAAFAQASSPQDRAAFGAGVHVAPGETVRDAVAFGGDAVVEGQVLGDAVSFGGSVILRGDGAVVGDVTSFGGSVVDERGTPNGPRARVTHHVSDPPRAARHDGPLDGFFGWLEEAGRSAVAHVLLFLLGLVLMGVTRERLRAMQRTMVRDGLKTAGTGLLAYVAAVVGVVVLALTLVGIPAAVVLGLMLPVATYVGLAAAATVIGAALPIQRLAGHEVLQLAAGVGVLFVASLVPVVGSIATAIAACLGFGALVRTRFRDTPPDDLPEGDGPFRTPVPA